MNRAERTGTCCQGHIKLHSPGAEHQIRHDLQSLTQEAKKYSFLGLELEARLVEAQVKLDSGKSKDGVAQLASLAEEAHLKGFGLIAKRAQAVRN